MAMFYDEDQQEAEEKGSRLCEWCGRREAEEERFVLGLGFLHLCRECALLLLSSLMDSG